MTSNRKRNLVVGVAATLLGLAALAGCESTTHTRPLAQPMEISLTPASRSVVVGDTLTIASQTKNMVGREATIEWTTTGGEITPADNNRIARMKFDKPGTYTVTARALVNGVVVDSDSVDIHVRDLNPSQPMLKEDLDRANKP